MMIKINCITCFKDFLGKPWNTGTTGVVKIWNKGKPNTKILKDKHWNWKGGITDNNVKFRNSIEYKAWRTAVYKRDNYTCVECGQHGGSLNADHIKEFAFYPELRLELSNGQTLCVKCHKQKGTYKGKNYDPKKELVCK